MASEVIACSVPNVAKVRGEGLTQTHMSETFDLLIRGGTVATAERHCPSRCRGYRRAHRRHRQPGQRQGGGDFRGQGPACAARRHRQPGAFPRAGQRAQGRSGNAAAAPPCWAASPACSKCPTPIRPPPRRAAIEDKLARAKNRMHCDYAFYVGRDARQYRRAGRAGAAARRLRREGVSGLFHRHAAAESSPTTFWPR